MKLYQSKGAPNPRLVRVFLAEKNIQVPMDEVDLAKGENFEPEFRRLNPLAQVPVLELDDGTCITETTAICGYFEALQPAPRLLGGPEAPDQARVEMWRRRIEYRLWWPIMQTFRNSHRFFAGRIEQCPEYAEVCRREAQHSLAWLDRELTEREYIAGDGFSIADITAMVAIDFGRVPGIRLGEDHANLKRWHAQVASRPSAKA